MHLASERGVAENSRPAYRRDLEDVVRFLVRRNSTLTKASPDDLRAYLQGQSKQGRSTKTVARDLSPK